MLKKVLKQASTTCSQKRLYTTAAAATINPAQAASAVAANPAVKPYEAIPKAKGLPLVGNLFEMTKRKAEFHYYLNDMSNEYGPVVRLTAPQVELVLVSDPQDFQTIFYAKDSMRNAMPLWRKYREENKKPITLVTLNQDEDWRSQRHVVNVMLRPALVESYYPRLSTIGDNLVAAISKSLNEKSISPNLQQIFYKFGLEAILSVLYGRKAGLLNAEKEDQNMRDLINSVLEVFTTSAKLEAGFLWKYFTTPLLKKNYAAWDQLYASGKKIHYDSLNNPNRENYFEDGIQNAAEIMLHQANSKNMSEEMRDVLNAEAIAGAIDTTGNALNAAMYILAKYPDIQERLYQEIKSIVPDKKQPITAQDISKMPTLKDSIKEVLRMFPPAAQNARVSTQNVVVSGYEVPAGKMFLMNFYHSSHNPKYFDDPHTFNPDRYKSEKAQQNFAAFCSLPFGFGPRMCIGSRIAQGELQTALCKVLLNFKLEYQGEYPAFRHNTINMFVPKNDDERVRIIPRK